jgi:kinesin family protein 11
MLKHVAAQKEEANSLRRQLTAASELAMQANIAAEIKLDQVLRQEKAQAVTDRQNLLSQITSLVMAQGETQDSRLTDSIHGVRQDIIASKEAFESSHQQYSVSMDTWNEDEIKLVEEVNRSREALKSKLKEDWAVSAPKTKICLLSLICPCRLPTNIFLLCRQPPSLSMRRVFALLTSK